MPLQIDGDHPARLRQFLEVGGEVLGRTETTVQDDQRIAGAPDLVIELEAIDGCVAGLRRGRGHWNLLGGGAGGEDQGGQQQEALHGSTSERPKASTCRGSKVVISATRSSAIRRTSILNARNLLSPGARR